MVFRPVCAEIRGKALQAKILCEIEKFNAIDLSQTIWGENQISRARTLPLKTSRCKNVGRVLPSICFLPFSTFQNFLQSSRGSSVRFQNKAESGSAYLWSHRSFQQRVWFKQTSCRPWRSCSEHSFTSGECLLIQMRVTAYKTYIVFVNRWSDCWCGCVAERSGSWMDPKRHLWSHVATGQVVQGPKTRLCISDN